MGNRYTNEGRNPRDLYDDSDRGEFRGRSGRHYNDGANRQNPTFRDRSSHGGEHYFGSGQMGYGDGIEDAEPNRAFGSSWRDSTGNSNYDTPERRYDSTRRRAGFGRDAYGLGYGGDWEPEANRQRNESRGLDRNRHEGRNQNERDDNRDYPSSESGFYNTRTGGHGDDRSWWDRASDEVSSWFGGEPDRGNYSDQQRGHRGRGPKNYSRSDDRIREDINDRLTDHDYLDASDIDVEVTGAEVTLTGTVNSRRAKRMAEDIAEDVSGVKNVENRLRIADQSSSFAGRGFGYDQVTGHGELNRQEVDATHDNPPDQTRTATGNR